MTNPYSTFDSRFSLPIMENSCRPVFILSCIWRSGSTLLQRTLCTDPSIIVWGEPYADCNLISSLATSAKALQQEEWPRKNNFAWGQPRVFDEAHQFFIANLYPEPNHIRDAYRAMLDRLFFTPAKDKGFDRYGVKFVRLGLQEAYFLQWLYPDAQFLFLFRNPWDCWRSYKGYRWSYRYPKVTIKTVEQFARLWNKQSKDLLQFNVGSGGWIRYEDFLKKDFDLKGLGEFCGLKLTRAALEKRIMGVNQEPEEVSQSDCDVISFVCGDLAKKLGYIGLKNSLEKNPFQSLFE